MLSKNKKRFEFNLGKTGLLTFITGGAFLMLLSFLLGVVVGRDTESMPRLAWLQTPHRLLASLSMSAADELPGKSAQVTIVAAEDAKVEAAQLTAGGAPVGAGNTTSIEAMNKARQAVANETSAGESKTPVPVVSAKKPTKEEKFVVRYGLFRQKENAEELAKRLKANGLRARQAMVNIPDKGAMVAIISSDFNDREKAHQFAQRVSKKLKGAKALVVPLAGHNPNEQH